MGRESKRKGLKDGRTIPRLFMKCGDILREDRKSIQQLLLSSSVEQIRH